MIEISFRSFANMFHSSRLQYVVSSFKSISLAGNVDVVEMSELPHLDWDERTKALQLRPAPCENRGSFVFVENFCERVESSS